EFSKRALVEQLIASLKCDELSIGDISLNDDHTIVEVHNKSATLAVRALNSNDITASIVQ
ncbi:MAG: DbpA RNA binding domain-containing protein, partial [Candidatus Poseidoniaceae archaeon]|nr:DbpA RNA binding domain-containing protein [Candidatus Poseidoniaceae archaeon]